MLWALGISKSDIQPNAMIFFPSITGLLGQILQKSWALEVVFWLAGLLSLLASWFAFSYSFKEVCF